MYIFNLLYNPIAKCTFRNVIRNNYVKYFNIEYSLYSTNFFKSENNCK